jgi:exosortase N
MSAAFSLNTKQFTFVRWYYVLPLIYIALFVTALQNYIQWQSVNFLIGILSLPVAAEINTAKKGRVRYGILALLFGVLAFLFPVKTLLYFAVLFALLYWTESFYGKTNMLLFILTIFLSPVFQFFTNVFSFPLRLQLTDLAGRLLQFAGIENTVEGNVILSNRNSFSVDPACMGLNMMITSLIAAIVLTAYWQKKFNKQVKLPGIVAVLGAVILLNIIANLLRIICMVQFTIMPESVMHEITGILFFVLYVLLPISFFIKFTVKKYGKENIKNNRIDDTPLKRKIIFHCFIVLVLLLSSYRTINHDNSSRDGSVANIIIQGYGKTDLTDGVIKLENKNSLVYIKRIPTFYSSDHTPYICWQGSGYSFQQIRKEIIDNHEVYTGILVKGNEQLHTSWWYDNGTDKTISQLKWRMDMLKGSGNYSIVNVSAVSKEQLIIETGNVLLYSPFKELLK